MALPLGWLSRVKLRPYSWRPFCQIRPLSSLERPTMPLMMRGLVACRMNCTRPRTLALSTFLMPGRRPCEAGLAAYACEVVAGAVR
ncbi:MAG: hypothetical protein IPN76_11760 [Saprospiraceae bacterium]|nr:hypothetical protein [Saprospiraceae bacterium]